MDDEKLKELLGNYWAIINYPDNNQSKVDKFSDFSQYYSYEKEYQRHIFINNENQIEGIKGILAEKIVALDSEWRPYSPAIPSILQCGSENFSLIFDLFAMKNIPKFSEFIQELFMSEKVRKIGHCFMKNDFKNLNDAYPNSGFKKINNFIDLLSIYETLTNNKINISLTNLSSLVLGKPISKQMQKTNWEVRPLSKKQRKYAIGDVAVALAIYKKLQTTSTVKDYELMLNKLVIKNY